MELLPNNTSWAITVKSIVNAILLYTIAGIVGNIADAFDTDSSLLSILSGEGPEFDFFGLLVNIVILAGYYLFFKSLMDFSGFQANEADKENVLKVRSGYLLLLIGTVVDIIPVIGGIAALVLYIIGYVKMLGSYKALSESAVLNDNCKGGFATLRTCIILTLVGAVIGIIPVIGGFIEVIITIVVFFKVLSAWKCIGNNEPVLKAE